MLMKFAKHPEASQCLLPCLLRGAEQLKQAAADMPHDIGFRGQFQRDTCQIT